jgi:hypothetical protein
MFLGKKSQSFGIGSPNPLNKFQQNIRFFEQSHCVQQFLDKVEILFFSIMNLTVKS